MAHHQKICDRWQAGDTMKAIAKDYQVNPKTIRSLLDKLNAYDRVKGSPGAGSGTDVKAFLKAARSILWSHDGGKEHTSYKEYEERVKNLQDDDGGGLTKSEAIVRAAKEHKCLHPLFREYNIAAFDPNPESHPNIKQWGDTKGMSLANAKVEFTGEEYNYQDCLRWAMEAAGSFMNTGEHPKTAPSGSAWFFYQQAIAEPKDFMAKFGQMEAKADDGSSEREKIRRDTDRTIEEIHEQLNELKKEEKRNEC
jgi:hypothetical protein